MIAEPLGLIYPYEAQCPVVDDLGDKYRVYYGRRDKHNHSYISFFEVYANDPTKIFYDHKAPIVQLGEEGAFDEHGMIPSSIITINGNKYLYYTGVSTNCQERFKNAVGVIQVKGKYLFNKLPAPVLTASEGEYFVGHMMVRLTGTGYDGYYCCCKEWRNNEPMYDIRTATSEDGLNWKKYEYPEIVLNPGEGGLCSFNVWKEEAVFCARDKEDYRENSKHAYRLELATWEGFYWERRKPLTIPRSDWDSVMQCYPYVFKYLLFYNGNGFGKTGVGLARLS